MDKPLSLRVRSITIIAGVMGVVQSLLWMVGSCVAIASYHQCLFMRNVNHMIDLYGILMHSQYFLSSDCRYPNIVEDNEVITAEAVNVWMIIMLCLNVCWFVTSVILCAYKNRVISNNIMFAMYTWIIFGMAVLVVDMTVGTLFGFTYTRLGVIITENPNHILTSINYLVVLQLSTLTLMTLALKGYIVLLANLIILLAMLAIVCDEYTLERDNRPLVQRTPIQAFESMPSIGTISGTTAEMPPLRQKDQSESMPSIGGVSRSTAEMPQLRQKDHIERMNTKDWGPRAQLNDSMPFSYTENNRWSNPTPHHSNDFPLQPVKPRSEERIDNLPYVPDPDYSPLGQRRLKSALKISP